MRFRALEIREDIVRAARHVQLTQRGEERDSAGEQLVSVMAEIVALESPLSTRNIVLSCSCPCSKRNCTNCF